MLKQERDELGQRQEVDKHFWAAFGLQNPALQKNRQQAEAAARERAELAEQVQTLRRELDERRRSDAVTNPQAGEVISAKSAANGTKDAVRTVQNTYFQNRTIVLDGHEYAGCELWDCRLVFQGQESFSIHDCRLGGCRLVFESAAQTTLGTLRALYQDFAFRSMVEYTIKQIMGVLAATPGSMGR